MENNPPPPEPWSQTHPEVHLFVVHSLQYVASQSQQTYRSGWDHTYTPPERVSSFSDTVVSRPENSLTVPNTGGPVQVVMVILIHPQNVPDPFYSVSPQPVYVMTETTTSSLESTTRLLFDELSLLQVAGEITEVEAVELRNMVLQGDRRVVEALRQHSLLAYRDRVICSGNSHPLVALLHRDDTQMDLLFHRDEEYAAYIEDHSSESILPNPMPITNSVTETTSTLVVQNSIMNAENQYYPNASIPYSPAVRNTLPHLFYCDGDLCGMIMKRTQTKVFFKKWKHCIFVIKPLFLLLYATIDDWKQNRGAYWQKQLHRGIVFFCRVFYPRL